MDDTASQYSTSVDSMASVDMDADRFAQLYEAVKLKDTSRARKFVIFNTGHTTTAEFYSIIRRCLSEHWAKGIVKVSRIETRKSQPRLAVLFRQDLAEHFRKSLRETFRDGNPTFRSRLSGILSVREMRNNIPMKWRIAEWKSYCDRAKATEGKSVDRTFSNVLTWNVNGFESKKLQIENCLWHEKVAIAMIQETLQSSQRYPLRIKGYSTFSIDRKMGFRGQAILVRNELPAYQIPNVENCILHVKVSQWKHDRITHNLHVVSLYLPSGGNRRADRTRLFDVVKKLYRDTKIRDKGCRFILAGDFNEAFDSVSRRLNDCIGLSVINTKGSNLSRFPKVGDGSDLDHFVMSDELKHLFTKPRVLRSYIISDHRPVKLSGKRDFDPPTTSKRVIFDRRLMNVKRQELADDNRWLIHGLDEMETNDMVDTFNKRADIVQRDLRIKSDYTQGDSKPKLPRQLSKLLRKFKRATKARAKGNNSKETVERWTKAKAEFRRAQADWNNKLENRSYNRVCEDMLARDFKSAWTRLGNKTHQGSGSNKGNPLRPNQPLRDVVGQLHTDPSKVQEIMTQHYRDLHQADPRRYAHNPRYWEATIPILKSNDDDLLDNYQVSFTWPEVLGAIRAMNRDTAPGKDELHINMFKALVREESIQELQDLLPGRTRWDGIQVDLPQDLLPEVPRTKLGKSVWTILLHIWDTEEMPLAWQDNVVISLFKGGDPEVPGNYRGITLISVLQKILTGVIMRGLYQHLDDEELFDVSQGGFRPGEEAIGHFIALSEIVRRRFLKDSPLLNRPTYAAFIDLKKAYDKVPIELVLAVLRKQRFPSKLISIIRSIYKSTRIVVRAGGSDSDPYELWRGLRQGCLMSPVLFIVFVTNILGYVHEGIGVGTPERMCDELSAGNCDGLLYADDIVAFEDSIQGLKEFLKGLSEWCNYWWMEVGVSKCGVMLWTTSDTLKAEFNATTFTIDDLEIPKVDNYKYLGITVDYSLPTSRQPLIAAKNNEESYVNSLVKIGMNTLHQLRPVLVNRRCPMPLKTMLIRTFLIPKMLYGAEWLGFRQLNSSPLQRVVDTAIRWAIGLRGKSNTIDATSLLTDLAIPSLEEELGAARARLFLKASSKKDKNRTWLSLLSENTKKTNRSDTWVSGSKRYISEILELRRKYSPIDIDDKNIFEDWFTGKTTTEEYEIAKQELYEKLRPGSEYSKATDVPLREWAARGQAMETDVRSNRYRSPHLKDIRESLRESLIDVDIDFDFEEDLSVNTLRTAAHSFNAAYERSLQLSDALSRRSHTPAWLAERVRTIRECIRERNWSVNKTVGFSWYDKFSFGMTRGFIRQTLSRPDLSEGVRWLINIRTRSYPRVEQHWLNAKFGGHQPAEGERYNCPLCGEGILNNWEWAHLLRNCKAVVAAANRHILEKSIKLAQEELSITGLPNLEIDEVDNQYGKLWGACSLLLVGGTPNNYFGSTLLYGFGATDILPGGLDTFVWLPTAQFLQIVTPFYLSALGAKLKRNL